MLSLLLNLGTGYLLIVLMFVSFVDYFQKWFCQYLIDKDPKSKEFIKPGMFQFVVLIAGLAWPSLIISLFKK